jgi:hypothetical protein
MDQWPKEIQKFRPGSTVQTISKGFSAEDRVRKLKAINSGELKCDFLVMSASVLDITDATKANIDKDLASWQKRTGQAAKGADSQKIYAKHIATDPLVQELKKMDAGWAFDEIHSGQQGLKEPNDLHHMIAKEILGEKEYAFGMSATPMTAGPADMYHLLNVFHPGAAGESLSKFESKMVQWEDRVDPETGKVLATPVQHSFDKLSEARNAIAPYVFFQRKTSKLVQDEMTKSGRPLPKLSPTAHGLTLEGEAKQLYLDCSNRDFDKDHEPYGGYPAGYKKDSEMYADLVKSKGEKSADAAMRMRSFIRQQRASVSPKLIDKNYKGPQPKIDETVEIVNRHFADPANANRPVCIFASWMDSLDLMKQELVKKGLPEHLIGTITGQVKQEDRDVTQEALNQGKLKVVLVGIKAGGAGLNLQGRIDPETNKPTGSFRSVFLDKPWTPADMEQAVGRTWRTGSPSETVHVHHFKIAGTVDDRKYEKLTERVQLNDALSFADLGPEYVAQTVDASIKNLVGSFDKDIKEWTPEQKKESLKLAGLRTGDVPPMPEIEAVRQNYDKVEFGKGIAEKQWKAVGDQKIEEFSTMNDLRYKDGSITQAKYERTKKTIGKMAQRWLSMTKEAMTHPVARFIGENFDYKTEADVAVGNHGGTTEAKRKHTEKPMKGDVAALPLSQPVTKPIGAPPMPKRVAA